jgi:hypothetical protein
MKWPRFRKKPTWIADEPPATGYVDHVPHPRYGKGPRFTGSDPNPEDPEVHLHRNTGIYSKAVQAHIDGFLGDLKAHLPKRGQPIPGTALAADLQRQSFCVVPVSHYYDIDCECRDCRRPFIFFAEEQKHWYEDLKFPLDADCVRCVECRKNLRTIERHRRRYEELFHLPLTPANCIESAECALFLIEAAIFPRQKTERVRMLLKSLPAQEQNSSPVQSLWSRVLEIEAAPA